MDLREPRILGRTGLRVSRLGIAAGYGVPAAAVEKAHHEAGVNYFYWGTRKAGMRDALRRLAAGRREKIVIAVQSYDHLGFFVRGSVEKGLRALGIDYADIFVFGWFNRPPAGRALEAALRLREEGKVRFLAMSGHSRKTHGRVAADPDSPIDVLMCRYNAVHRGAEHEIFPLLPGENRPGVTTYTATRWGHLLQPKRMPPGERALTSAECYRFVLSHPDVDVCLTGPATAAHMDEALEALEAGPLDEEEMARVRRIGDHLHARSPRWMG
jgi:aryl-alcohol dehydrogenase-like predicted oxidoreductase